MIAPVAPAPPWRRVRRLREAITALSWSGDGHLLAVGSAHGELEVVAGDGTPLGALCTSRHLGVATTVLAWHPRRRELVAGGGDGSLVWWQAARDSVHHIAHRQWVTAARWHPTEELLAVGAGNDLLIYRDQCPVAEAPFGVGSIGALVWAVGPGELAVGNVGGVRWYDVASLADPVALYPAPGAVTSMSLSPEGDRLAVGDLSGELRIGDLRTGAEVGLLGYPDRLRHVAWQPDGTAVVVVADDEVGIWRVGHGIEPPDDQPTSLLGGSGRIDCLAVHPRRQVLAVGHAHGDVVVWDLVGHVPLAVLSGRDPITAVAWSADGRTLAAGVADGSVLLGTPLTGTTAPR
ncbi:MAG: hypothetical protein JJU45_14155 [Acidimicrobiia bacterium]|nr:hypothetical protein [Acidimicrobiia bacterium]